MMKEESELLLLYMKKEKQFSKLVNLANNRKSSFFMLKLTENFAQVDANSTQTGKY